MLCGLLQGEDHDVLSAVDGKEALEMVRESPPDLVISDILMPEMDGFDLCWEIKSDPGLTHIPIIFYTATYGGDEDKKLGLLMGASRYIIKPQEPEILIKLINEVLLNDHDEKRLPISQESSEFQAMISRMHLESKNRKLLKKTTEMENIKDQKEELSKQLVQLAADFQTVSQSVSDFSFVASHDLIEPLRKIVTYSSMLREVHGDSMAEYQHAYLSTIEKASLKMKKSIEDLRDPV